MILYTSETKIVVRYVETDKMSIVHHSNYYVYFEEARAKFIKESGMSYSEMEKYGVMFPLIESSCKYIQGARYEDELIIKTWMTELTPVKAEFNYSVIRQKDQKEIAKGSTLHAFVNNDFKIINLRRKHPTIFERLQSLI